MMDDFKGKNPDRTLLLSIYQLMLNRFGHRNWWPGDSPLEICVGAILTQNTSWKNVAKAIRALKDAQMMETGRMREIGLEELAGLIRPAGYYNVKAVRLKNFIDHIFENRKGDLEDLFDQPMGELRKELLSINGIGPETADSIILYAAKKPIFVVDAYTRRILGRHGMVGRNATYEMVQALFHEHLEPDEGLYNDFHAQFVAVGHHYCKPKPRCQGCPLESLK
jgi:endonuclease-3 related protein